MLLALVATLLVACWSTDDRMIGPTVRVRNDSGRDIVVDLGDGWAWLIPAGESRFLMPVGSHSWLGHEASFDIRDPATCAVLQTAVVPADFDDSLIIVPASGPATVVRPESTGGPAMPPVERDPTLCLEPSGTG